MNFSSKNKPYLVLAGVALVLVAVGVVIVNQGSSFLTQGYPLPISNGPTITSFVTSQPFAPGQKVVVSGQNLQNVVLFIDNTRQYNASVNTSLNGTQVSFILPTTITLGKHSLSFQNGKGMRSNSLSFQANYLMVLSPNGGEVIKPGSTYTVRWASAGTSYVPTVSIVLQTAGPIVSNYIPSLNIINTAFAQQVYYLLASTTNDGSQDVLMPSNIFPGFYKLYISGAVTGASVVAVDLSDKSFLIGSYDLNNDGKVDQLDRDGVASAISQGQYLPQADFNFDGVLNIKDLQVLYNNFTNKALYFDLLTSQAGYDGKVDQADRDGVASQISQGSYFPQADFNFDGKVTIADLKLLYANFTNKKLYFDLTQVNGLYDGLVSQKDRDAVAETISRQTYLPQADFNFDGLLNSTDLAIIDKVIATQLPPVL